MILVTERLRLRRARPEDVGDLHAVYGDARAMKYWSSGPDQSPEETRRRIEIQFGQEPPGYFVMERDGRAIGNAGHVDDGEIGFILHPDHWRQGLAREALGAIIPHLFRILPYPALRAEVDPRNLGSVGLLTSLGFMVTGFSRDYYLFEGTPCDSVYMRLPRPGPSQ